jgi:hypothetical protein
LRQRARSHLQQIAQLPSSAHRSGQCPQRSSFGPQSSYFPRPCPILRMFDRGSESSLARGAGRVGWATNIATDQRAPPACRCDILVACPANDGPIVSLAQLRSRMVQHCGRSTMSESSCSTTFPKTTKRGGHGRRHARYCSLPLMAWPMSAQSHAKSNLRYFSRPSRWRNDRGARLDFLRSRWAQRCEIVKACKDRGIGIWCLLPLIWF